MTSQEINTFQGMPLLLTCEQVCGELGVSRVTLWRLIKTGKIKSIRVSRRCIRIASEELRAFLDRAKAA